MGFDGVNLAQYVVYIVDYIYLFIYFAKGQVVLGEKERENRGKKPTKEKHRRPQNKRIRETRKQRPRQHC